MDKSWHSSRQLQVKLKKLNITAALLGMHILLHDSMLQLHSIL